MFWFTNQRKFWRIAAALCALAAPFSVRAQTPVPRFGTEFAYAGYLTLWDRTFNNRLNEGIPAIAFWYHWTPDLAVTFRTAAYAVDTERESSVSISRTKSVFFTVAAELPYTIYRYHTVGLYLAPGVGYTRATDDYTSRGLTGLSDVLGDRLYISNAWLLMVVVGMHVNLSDQLALIARASLAGRYQKETTTDGSGSVSSQTYGSIGIESWSAGLIVYLF